ncbi:MAG: hypothetical protein KKD94_03585, partial [Nanoarchaeota archaeon]|nr:hypothetical protein [Nanoarchaeota archaeon]
MKRKVIQFFVLLVGVVVLLAAVHFLRFGSLTGFAVFSDSGQGDFDLGTYDNTLWNGSAVVLAGGNLTGNYSSQVFDAGADAVWNNLTYDSTSPNIEFLYGVDGGGDVYQSVNLGVDWTMSKENFGRTTDTEDMFADSVYLYIISNSNKEIWRSEDGESWNVVNNSFVNSALLLGEKDSNENLFAVDGSGDVYLSSDNGINWELKGDFNAGATANAKGIAINSSNDIFIVDGNGDVFLSIDEGENWEKVNDGYGGGTYTDDLEVDSNDNLYILFNSEIYKSINQGVDWSLINEDYEGNQDGLEMLIDSSDNFFIIDPSGDVYKSIDYGLNWSLIGDFNLDASNDVKGFTSFIDESNLTYQVRNCSESDCSDGVWQDADLADLALVGRYFQYKIIFTSPDSSETPFLESIVIDYDVLDSVSPNISFSAETTVEGTYNSDAINVGVDVSDDSQIYSFINFDSSLVSFWKMNDSSGNVLDYSGNGYDGSVTGASYGVNGKFGNAMSFDGSGDYIIFGNINSFERTDEFSYSFWINTDSTTSYITIMSKTPYGSWQGMELFIVNSKLKLYLIGAAEQIEVSSTATVNTGTWRHVVIVCDGSSSASGVDIYVDGVEGSSGSGTLSSSIVNSNNFQISGRAGNYNCFDGLIDEFLVFNRVLTSDEILALYDSNSYSRNFTNLEDGSYDFYSYAQDTAGYENQTETRTVTLVSNTAPSLTLVSPQEGATYGTNESLDLEFSVSDADGNLDSCWYTLDLGETNFSLVGCANTTFDVSGSDSYNLTIYANDTSGLESSDDNSFSVQVGAPSITLISPIDVYLNSQDITFRYTPTDVDLDSCELWGDFDGEFKLNQTDTAPESGNENSFSLTLPDGIYLWNIKCNDTQGHEASNGNKTFYVDTVAPVIKLT